MKLKLLNQYQGQRITIGKITFDDQINNAAEYPFFYENGFSHLFEIIKPIPYKGVTNQKKK